MLLYSIQKTANFQHNGDKALNAHSLVVPIRGYGLLGGLSVSVCCVGMAVPLNRTGCKSPPLFLLVVAIQGNIAKQPITYHYEHKIAWQKASY